MKPKAEWQSQHVVNPAWLAAYEKKHPAPPAPEDPLDQVGEALSNRMKEILDPALHVFAGGVVPKGDQTTCDFRDALEEMVALIIDSARAGAEDKKIYAEVRNPLLKAIEQMAWAAYGEATAKLDHEQLCHGAWGYWIQNGDGPSREEILEWAWENCDAFTRERITGHV